uniref:Zinc finger CCCH-type with G patch domain-containing protein n=1 Tax=Geotrypetes seraphini TaxID=260995 RepID=A0A6P8SJI2_GEOSA|nr:zinc finger CCCH-type with G patch domain-containing protein isoform X1 [Geotrypetes seraphini]XP_033818953.1 zinc finger CCCH-type with G patch domain-containing protein isoform X1 [Geotrypetes seraphini]XP_033818954.1 zinc finger CCCH-type with G patch domain-containing protein isoform X1 [Geotrypetes seraphini]XP_033818956.1 zinc finger CCCH-type with G patch domain-containing protein isoform X1 [Geotrypetes seraphini]XP_033818957.1 zinc finger CCCH-type with G patch domain-containing pro
MDEDSLQSAIQSYNSQLQQVELALEVGLDSSQQADLFQLRESLKQLIELTESSLVSVRKGKRGAPCDTTVQAISPPGPHTEAEIQEDEEYTAFMAAISELSAESEHVRTTEEMPVREEPEECEDSAEDENGVSGMKVRAPYYSSWGTLEYHNAMIVGAEDSEDGSSRVRVLYLYPTHKAMKPCPYFLEEKCRFKDSCRFSHGQLVAVEELQPFQEPDLSSLEMGSACLAKHSDGIWYSARITDLDGGYYTVKFDSLLLKDAVLEGDGIMPPLRNEEGSSEAESEASDVEEFGFAKVIEGQSTEDINWNPVCSSSFAGWEVHTRGIGSKLLTQMGYQFGKGLGKNAEGRLEPVQAVVLPKGKSLDQCVEILQRKQEGKTGPTKIRKQGIQGKSVKCGSKRPKAPRNVFDFLNEKLEGKVTEEQNNPSTTQKNRKEMYHASESSKKALSVQLFQILEKIQQTQKKKQKIQEALTRNIGRDNVVTSQLHAQLSEVQKQLQQLKEQEASLQQKQTKANTHKKMTEF